MAVTDWKSPGTVVSDSSGGSGWWESPSYAMTSNGLKAYKQGSYTQGAYLKATNFGLTVPSGATIDGISVDIEKSSSVADTTKDVEVKIVKSDGTIGTTNKADTANFWTTTDTYNSYGGSSDLWGESWSSADVNDADFGAVLSVSSADFSNSARVDHIRIKVFYTESTTPTVGVKYPLPAFKR